jgi:hypothetical protein
MKNVLTLYSLFVTVCAKEGKCIQFIFTDKLKLNIFEDSIKFEY